MTTLFDTKPSATGNVQSSEGSARTRIAHCCCGSLRAEAAGEPALVAVCHCTECQRRTGSSFGVSTYFPKGQVRTVGPSKFYLRGSDSGRKIEFHFCPGCGSTVFWYAELVPELIGVAFGAFADASMPWPTVSVWETTRHPWVTFDHQLDRFTVQPKIDDRDRERPSHGAANIRDDAIARAAGLSRGAYR